MVVLISSCQNQEPVKPPLLPSNSVVETSDVWGVVTADSLRLRLQPSLRAKILSNLIRGEVVKILKRGDVQESINGATNYWFEVMIEGVNGWVFGSHLELVRPTDRRYRRYFPTDSTQIQKD